ITGFPQPRVSQMITADVELVDRRKQDNRTKLTFEEFSKITNEVFASKFDANKQVQVFFNFKGGTGKTSICHQTSVLMALMGFKVLAIDCDPQGHLSHSLGFDEYQDQPNLYDIIENGIPIHETIHTVYEGYDAIPANLAMTKLELCMSHKMAREMIINKLLEPLKQEYDFIFLDTNPTISILNTNALLAADMVNIICETQPYSLKGLELLVNEITSLEEELAQKIDYRIIANKYESKAIVSQEALGALRYNYPNNVMNSIIRKCEDFNISAKMKKPVFFFNSMKSAAVQDIVELSREIIGLSCIEQPKTNRKVQNAA
ncbi:MAG: ParA family protein, partial [Alphaproteobacteria bacterium]